MHKTTKYTHKKFAPVSNKGLKSLLSGEKFTNRVKLRYKSLKIRILYETNHTFILATIRATAILNNLRNALIEL